MTKAEFDIRTFVAPDRAELVIETADGRRIVIDDLAVERRPALIVLHPRRRLVERVRPVS